MRDREGVAWVAVFILAGILTIQAALDMSGAGKQPVLAYRQVNDADSVRIYMFGAETDTVWAIYIPSDAMPPLDTLGVEWWSEGWPYRRIWSGWENTWKPSN